MGKKYEITGELIMTDYYTCPYCGTKHKDYCKDEWDNMIYEVYYCAHCGKEIDDGKEMK